MILFFSNLKIIYYDNYMSIQDKDSNKVNIIIICPHCEDPIIIEELNCCIFRHGILIESGKQIDPHSSFELCKYYVEQKKIYGCGMPFQIVKDNDEFKVIICGYI
jgi:hypothetical protein